MKSIFLTILLSLTYLISSAQTELPRYLIEGGDTIGVIISIEQAQKLDNNSELLELFKKLSATYLYTDNNHSLNLAIECDEMGIWEKYNVKLV
jgi:hypothetical protein